MAILAIMAQALADPPPGQPPEPARPTTHNITITDINSYYY